MNFNMDLKISFEESSIKYKVKNSEKSPIDIAEKNIHENSSKFSAQ